MSLFATQLRRDRAVLIGWSIGLFLYMFVIGASYVTFKDQPELDELWANMPEGLREAFGGCATLTQSGCYLESQGTTLLPLVIGGALLAQATRRLSGAEQSGEVDLLLSLPVRRLDHYWSHAAVGATLAVSWLAAAAAGTVLGFLVAGTTGFDLVRLTYMVFEPLPFVLLVHSGALLAGAALHRRGPGTAILSVFLASTFLLNILSGLSQDLRWLRWLSPYSLWLEGDPFRFDSNGWYVLVCLGLAVPMAVLGAWRWNVKDLKG